MASINNVQVYGLDESIYRSGYPMLERAPTKDEFVDEVDSIRYARIHNKHENQHIKRAIKLAKMKGGGHDQFLTGITVAADITLSNKCWVEAERYTFLNFISSMSTVTRISKFSIKECCNPYVDEKQIEVAESLQAIYNNIDDRDAENKRQAYLALLYNLPSGFELMAGMTTNYRCLKNIWQQRRQHRLPDWHVVCDWIEALPMARDLICFKRT